MTADGAGISTGAGGAAAKPSVLVIDPDALDWGGHFMAYNDKLTTELKRRGYPVTVICNERLDAEILRERPHFVPRLSIHSWDIGSRFADELELARCEAELTAAIDELTLERPTIVYMYTGSVDYASMLGRMVAEGSLIAGHVNLFWAAYHDAHWGRWIDRYAQTLQELGAAGPRLQVTVPTSSLQSAIAEVSGEVFPVAAHPSTSVADHEFALGRSDEHVSASALASCASAPAPFHVLFPGNPSYGKGFQFSLAAAKRLADQDVVRPVLRYYPIHGHGADHELEVEQLQGRVEVIRGELDNQGFLDLFRQCHISVLPYEPAAFGKRTSGLLIDSIYHGLPVVTTRRTWLGDMVQRYGCGAVVEGNTPEQLSNAVDEIVANYGSFAAKARAAARAYFADNSWADLAQSIVGGSAAMGMGGRQPAKDVSARAAEGPPSAVRGDAGSPSPRGSAVARPNDRPGVASGGVRLTTMDTAFVLGNGPSLRGVDLNTFTGVATVGMNAAYREWERVGWYPTHYCCLDDELIGSHHDAIRALLSRGAVHSAFLTTRILEFHPELREDERCSFLESFQKGGHYRQRGEEWGLSFKDHPAFHTSAPSKLTTGAYAVRYAMFLGYQRLYLLGIDCTYVPLEQARSAGGIALEMETTPDQNPNYFFDDYQQAGDRYNVPNPEIHGGNLHLQSLQAVRDDLAEGSLPVEVRNCSRTSMLASAGVFPYEDLDRALGRRLLGAVAVPMTFRDESSLMANLRRWDEPEMVPRYPGGDGYAVPLVLVLNGQRDTGFESRVRRAFEGSRLLHDGFSAIEFQYCALSAEEDKYDPEYDGTRSGPNAQFFRGMELLRDYGHYVFMMETDCLPIRPNWLGELERLVEGSEPFWVMGSLYRGVGRIGEHWRDHINGNAVYAVGDEEFQRFLSTVWRPALAALVQEIPGIAYDVVLPMCFSGKAPTPRSADGHLFQTVAHRFRYTNFIQNHAGKAETERGEGSSLEEIRERSPSTYILHGRHLIPATKTRRQPARSKPPADPGPGAASGVSLPSIHGPLPREAHGSVDESQVAAILLRRRRGRKCVMVDVGAHHGSALGPFAKAGWKVVACEPDSSNRVELVKRFGKKRSVTIDSRAISNEPARGANLFSSEESSGMSSLHAFSETHRETEAVDVTTVAKLVEDHGLSRIDFLKIDAEGLDWNVLKGVPWGQLAPDAIECEFEDAKTLELGYTYRDMADYLVERGYAVYLSEWHPIVRYGSWHDWRRVVRYPTPLATGDAWGNILAFRDDPGEQAIKEAFVSCLEVERPAATPAEKTGPRPEGARSRACVNTDTLGRDADRRPQRAPAATPTASAGSDGTVRHEVRPGPSRRPWIARPRGVRSRIRRKEGGVVAVGRARYERFYLWARTENPLLFSAGRLAMWCGRKAQRYPTWTAAYVALVASLTGLGFWSGVEPVGPLFWLAAGLLSVLGLVVIAIGYAGFLVKHADHESQLRDLRMKRRLERAETSLHSEQKATNDARAHIVNLRSEQATTRAGLEAEIRKLHSEQKATKDALARIDELESEQEATKDALAKLGEQRTTEALVRIRELQAAQQATKEALTTTIGELISEQKGTADALAKLGEQRAKEALGKIGELRSEQAATKDALEARIDELQSEQKAAKEALARIDELESEQEATKETLGAKIGELLSAQEHAREGLATEIGGLRSDREVTAKLEAEIDKLKSETGAISERALSLDIVSALRQIHPLWAGQNGTDGSGVVEEKEHGHAVLMALLVEEERQTPGILRGKTLIEIGSTRERDPRQGSTEKLAIFTAMTDMRFITVDMDPINTERALRVIELLNPAAKAVTERGEDYLATCSERPDYVYLDAFDFDHGQHSAERQARYREVLKTEIRDEACWQMHQLCAAALITKMPEGGIVAIDDTWANEAGDFDGKGKLAVPLLLSSGFTLVAQARKTIALKRAGEARPPRS